jgi:hypothetical protein
VKFVRCIHTDHIDDVAEWRPLEQICALTAKRARLPTLDADHFMYMMRLQTDAGVVVHAYKHIFTRCYLHLDDGGHAYWYVCSLGDEPDWPCLYRTVSLPAAVRGVADGLDYLWVPGGETAG